MANTKKQYVNYKTAPDLLAFLKSSLPLKKLLVQTKRKITDGNIHITTKFECEFVHKTCLKGDWSNVVSKNGFQM